MATRNRVKTIPTPDLQGTDSFIQIKRVTVGEADAFRKMSMDESIPKEEREQRARQFLSEHVQAWNWVDDDGRPFPQPLGNPEVFDLLTDEEFTFIVEQFKGVPAETKN